MTEKFVLAKKEYLDGWPYKDIAEKYGVSVNTVKTWKTRYQWQRDKSTKSKNTPKKDVQKSIPVKPKGGAPKGNQFAKGNKGNKNASGPPKGSQNAVRDSLFSKYIPKETLILMATLNGATPADIIWMNIEIQFAAILRAQQIMYVNDKQDLTREPKKVKESDNSSETEVELQFAWDKHAAFLTAQSKAMGELRNLIKQFNEMSNEGDERRLKLEQMKANLEKTKAEVNEKTGSGESTSTIIVNDVEEMRRVMNERSKDN